MNCKPNQLAVVLRPQTGPIDDLTDRIVTTVALYQSGGYVLPNGFRARFGAMRDLAHGALWVVTCPGHKEVGTNRLTGDSIVIEGYTAMWDSRLRPIENPSDDARDETLLWLPVPSKETESA